MARHSPCPSNDHSLTTASGPSWPLASSRPPPPPSARQVMGAVWPTNRRCLPGLEPPKRPPAPPTRGRPGGGLAGAPAGPSGRRRPAGGSIATATLPAANTSSPVSRDHSSGGGGADDPGVGAPAYAPTRSSSSRGAGPSASSSSSSLPTAAAAAASAAVAGGSSASPPAQWASSLPPPLPPPEPPRAGAPVSHAPPTVERGPGWRRRRRVTRLCFVEVGFDVAGVCCCCGGESRHY